MLPFRHYVIIGVLTTRCFVSPLLYIQRGPGKKKKKAAKKRKHAFAFNEADDEEWTPRSRY